MMQQKKKIEEIKKRIIEGRIRSNDERIRKYNESKEKRKKSLKLLDTSPNFFVAADDNGFCVIHLEAFMSFPKSKQQKLINIYK